MGAGARRLKNQLPGINPKRRWAKPAQCHARTLCARKAPTFLLSSCTR